MEPRAEERWWKMDLHVHTPASLDYREKDLPLVQILREAERRSLDIVGLVDHNTTRGYEQLRLELSRLAVLSEAGRLSPSEQEAWDEYRQLLSHILVLPGFELTTQEGVHLLALFPPETPAERLNALLLTLGIPMERLRDGAPEVYAQADLALACTLITRAGGIAIAAHIERLRGFRATQEEGFPPEGLLALESTVPACAPLGSLPVVWGSNAHTCTSAGEGEHPWGIGERYTEVLMERPSFDALRTLLLARDAARVRFPERERLRAYLEQLRRAGPDRLILLDPDTDPKNACRDIAALANSGGGTLVIGIREEQAIGVADPRSWSSTLLRYTREEIDPPPLLNLELLHFEGHDLVQVQVQPESPPPYVTREGVVYVRRDGQTRPATRAELMETVGAGKPGAAPGLDLPYAGVEIVGMHLRDGVWFYDVRDLRVTSGVTRQRAKGLWAYAIDRHESLRQGQADLNRVVWKGDRGVWRVYRSGERRVYDLVHRESSGRVDHVFYGVSEWGLTPRWREVVESLRPLLVEENVVLPEEGEPGPDEARSFRPARPVPPREGRTGYAPSVPRPQAAFVGPDRKEAGEAAPARPEGAPAPAGEWGGRIPRWRNQAAVEWVRWDGNNLYFDLAHRQADGTVRYFRRVPRSQLLESEGWIDLVRVPLPATGIEVVRSTVSGDEILYQFRDMQTGRVDPRVRRASEFPPDSPYAYAIRMYHQDFPLDESKVRWWGNIGYMRPTPERVDLVYRDEEGRDHIYYAAERRLLEGEWKQLLEEWHEE
ncbi:MAG: RNA-binding domain-containing protein [Chloroflexia bacterium]